VHAQRVKDLGALVNSAGRDIELDFLEFARTILSPFQMAKLIIWIREQAPASANVEPVPPINVALMPRATHATPAELARERIILLTKVGVAFSFCLPKLTQKKTSTAGSLGCAKGQVVRNRHNVLQS